MCVQREGGFETMRLNSRQSYTNAMVGLLNRKIDKNREEEEERKKETVNSAHDWFRTISGIGIFC